MARRKGSRKTGGRKKGTPNKATHEIKIAARELVESATYRRNLQRRLNKGRAPQMEVLLHHYAYGRPRQFVELSGPAGGPIEVALTKAKDSLMNKLARLGQQAAAAKKVAP